MEAVRVLSGVVVMVTVAGCCDADLQSRISPANRTLAVGESFTPSVELLSCGGTRPLSDVITWSAQDSTVVRVDPGTGRTTALRSGTTSVVASGAKYGYAGAVTVVVAAR